MEHDSIRVCQTIFTSVDRHDWDTCRACFADTVFADYSSFTGQPGSDVSAGDLVNNWKSFLPGFEFTLHYLTNFEADIDGNDATVRCYGHAVHGLDGQFWEVYGSYDFSLVQKLGTWKVTRMTYHHKHAAGNMELPKLAAQRGAG